MQSSVLTVTLAVNRIISFRAIVHKLADLMYLDRALTMVEHLITMDIKLEDPFHLNMMVEHPFELKVGMLEDINLDLVLVHIREGKQEEDYLGQILLDKHFIDYKQFNQTCIITNDNIPEEYKHAFDFIVPIPWTDVAKDSAWKIENRWKIIYATPFKENIVYDTDMLLLNSNDHWWPHLSKQRNNFHIHG